MKKMIGAFITSLFVMFGMISFSTYGGQGFSIIKQLFLSLQELQIGHSLPLLAWIIGGFVGGIIVKTVGKALGITAAVVTFVFFSFSLIYALPVNFLDFLLVDLVAYLIPAIVGSLVRR